MSAAVLHSLPLQIFTLANLPCPQPTEEDPYQWTDVPAEFGMARGIGGGTPFTMNAKDAGFEITCKGTDAAHAFMFARRSAQQAAKLTGGWSGDTMTWFRGDTGETWVGTGCVIEAVPAGASTQSPAAVTWRVLVGYLTIQAPDLIPVTA